MTMLMVHIHWVGYFPNFRAHSGKTTDGFNKVRDTKNETKLLYHCDEYVGNDTRSQQTKKFIMVVFAMLLLLNLLFNDTGCFNKHF